MYQWVVASLWHGFCQELKHRNHTSSEIYVYSIPFVNIQPLNKISQGLVTLGRCPNLTWNLWSTENPQFLLSDTFISAWRHCSAGTRLCFLDRRLAHWINDRRTSCQSAFTPSSCALDVVCLSWNMFRHNLNLCWHKHALILSNNWQTFEVLKPRH